MINLIIDLLIGAFSGWLVTRLMNMDSTNMIFNCMLGLVGGIVAGFPVFTETVSKNDLKNMLTQSTS